MREVQILHDLVNQVRLWNLDILNGEGLNVDIDVVIQVPLILNIKLGSLLCDCLTNYCISWEGKHAVVHIDDE